MCCVAGLVQIHLGSVYSCADNGTIKRWDLEASEATMDYVGHYGPVWCIECFGQQMFTGGDDCVTRVWDINTGDCHRQFVGHSAVLALSIVPTALEGDPARAACASALPAVALTRPPMPLPRQAFSTRVSYAAATRAGTSNSGTRSRPGPRASRSQGFKRLLRGKQRAGRSRA